ncbi:MAG: hypothetical protein ACR2NZ_08430 [Rubripirellula sp.]
MFDPRPELNLMLTDRPNKSRLFAYFAAGALSLAVTGSSLAGTCGCQSGCQTCPPPTSSCGCSSCECAPKKSNCLQKHFTKLASHFKSLLPSKKGCDTCCDDGCDAAMIDELMLPAPTELHHDHAHSHHNHAPSVPPALPHDYESITPPPAEPSPLADPSQGNLKMTQPSIEVSPTLGGEQPKLMPPPVRNPQVEEPKQEGGLFDSLRDPFDDDQTSRRVPQPVRPTAYDQIELRPITRLPLPNSQTSSRRRASSDR